MRLPRNPFRSTKVESIGSHDLFLKLFQPMALGVLGDSAWDSVQVIRSAQGGGKTSLLQIFTPECLVKVAEGNSEHLSDIAEQLKRIGAIQDEAPATLGVYLPLGTTPYATIARSKLTEQNPLHLFYALLDARAVLTAIRGAQVLRGLNADVDNDRITFNWPEDSTNPLCEFKSARDIITWARSTEREIWRAIDRGKVNSVADRGHARPYSLEALSNTSILVDGNQICEHVVIMVDDAHKLEAEQRKELLRHVITARLKVSFWVAERMYAMEPYELLALDTSSTAREYKSTILSMWWQKASDSNSSKFYNQLASKRLQESGVETPFDHLVPSVVEDAIETAKANTIIGELTQRLDHSKVTDIRFSEVSLGRKPNQKPFDYLIDLKAIDLYMAGINRKPQGTLDFEGSATPTSDELSKLRGAAEYQICTQNGLPLYYGASTIYKIASWNVDQFLALASGVYDQFDVQRIRNTGTRILPRVQEKIIRDIAKTYYSGLAKRMPNGEKMQRFLQVFARHALTESLADTAKYPPGITGIGFTSRDHDRLRKCTSTEDPNLVEFASLLSSAVAHNVVFMKADSKQGRKGDTVTVFYLNRLLCVYLGLPIGLGGWWRRKVDHFAKLLAAPGSGPEDGLTASLFDGGERERE